MTDDKIPTSGVREEDIPASYAACVERMDETFEEWQDAHEVMEQGTGTVLGGVVGAVAGGGTGAVLGALVGGAGLRATDFFDQAADNVEAMRDHAVQENCDSILNSVAENTPRSSESQEARNGEGPTESVQEVEELGSENMDDLASELSASSSTGNNVEPSTPAVLETEDDSEEAQSIDALTPDADSMDIFSSLDQLESSSTEVNDIESMCTMSGLDDIAPDYGPTMPSDLDTMPSSDTSALMSELPNPDDLAPDYGPPMSDDLGLMQSESGVADELMSAPPNQDDLASVCEPPLLEELVDPASRDISDPGTMCEMPSPEDIGPDYGPPLPEGIENSDENTEAGVNFSSP